MEGDQCYSASSNNCEDANGQPLVPLPCNDNAFTDPFAWHVHSGTSHCSVTGGYVYRGSAIASLQGWYIYGDYCSGTIWAAVNDNGWIVNELMTIGFGITTFGEDADGELYVAQAGTVYRFTTPDTGLVFTDGFESL